MSRLTPERAGRTAESGPADGRLVRTFCTSSRRPDKRAARAADRARGLRSGRPSAPARANARRLARNADNRPGRRENQREDQEMAAGPAAGRRTRAGARAWSAHASTVGRVAQGAALRSRCLRRGPPAPGWPRSARPLRWVGGYAGTIPPAVDPGKPSRPPRGCQGRTAGVALHLVTLGAVRSHNGRVDGERDGQFPWFALKCRV